MEAKIYNQEGKEEGVIKLPKEFFGEKWNPTLVHSVYTAMLANKRTSTANTKTRGEVRGGGKKPWQQKGTGRARHGSSRSPIWVGGGITHGPRSEKDYSRKINKKEKNKALFISLSRKFADNEIIFVDSLKFDKPNTKKAQEFLTKLSGIKEFAGLKNKKKNNILLLIQSKNVGLERSFSNLPQVDVSLFKDLNTVDLMDRKHILILEPKEAVNTLKAKIKSSVR